MSRQELAEAVNAHVHRTTGRITAMDAHYVGRLERGQRRWPSSEYRDAFRAVLGTATDAELGFGQRDRDTHEEPTHEPQLVIGLGTVLILMPTGPATLAALSPLLMILDPSRPSNTR
jgi:hypothetical protein